VTLRPSAETEGVGEPSDARGARNLVTDPDSSAPTTIEIDLPGEASARGVSDASEHRTVIVPTFGLRAAI
jgi:hypothetical protein